MPYANTRTTGITTMDWKTNPSPDSHNSTPSHQLRNPFTGLTLFRVPTEANTDLGSAPFN
jgi:hypothetical protein